MSMHVWPEGCSVFAATADGKLFTTDDEGDTWRVLEGIPPVAKGRHSRLLQGVAAARSA